MEPSRFRPIVTVLATILTLGLSIYVVLLTVARSGDERQQTIERIIVQSALTQVQEKLGGIIAQNAEWNTAYDGVTEPLDADWAAQQLVPYSNRSGVKVTLVANAHGALIFTHAESEASADAKALKTSSALTALVTRALAAPAPFATAITGYAAVHGRLYLGAAQRIVPDDDRAKGPLPRRFVLVYLMPLEAPAIHALQTGFHIATLRQSFTPDTGLASVALRDAGGKAVAYLNWRAAQPGEAFANAAAPFAFDCFAIVGLLQFIVLRSWMRAGQRLRDEGVAKTMFLANVSHELRTPLNAIIGFSECIARELFGPISPRYKGYADDILASGNHLLGIVNDVLDLSELNSSKAVALEPMDLSAAMIQPLSMLREYARSEAIEVRFVDRCGSAWVVANEKAVGQILLNLGSNAVKFSPRGEAVEITLRNRTRPNGVELVVHDRGTGMSEKELRLIGQPFFQAHNATARKPGSGLGLAIVKTLVERLKGELVIESTLGIGTTATVRLPLHRHESRAPASSEAA
jgi:two-component system cell cycle sensor histidine kinase PleC